MINLAIIDSDTIVYKAAGACQRINPDTKEVEVKDPVEFAYGNAKRLMQQILEATKVKDYVAYLTATNDKTSFRSILYPEYKANRKDLKRPVYYEQVREYLIKYWKAEVVDNIEADDAVCKKMHECYKNIEHLEDFIPYPTDVRKYLLDNWNKDNLVRPTQIDNLNLPAVLCGIDKDLDQIPGLHYNYNKDEFYYITPIEGLRSLYLQMLTGDSADNIPRIKKGWRQAKAEKDIQNAQTEIELINIVRNEIKNIWPLMGNDLIEEKIQWLGDLLYLRKNKEDRYRIPNGQL